MKKLAFPLLILILLLVATACSSGAVSTNLTPAASPIIPANAVLVFTTQPGAGIAGVALSVQPVVTIEDANGNVVDADAAVTITITPGTGASGGFLAGTMKDDGTTGPMLVYAVKGVATFDRVAIIPYGTGYTLTATSPGIKSAVSLPFDVAVASAGSQ